MDGRQLGGLELRGHGYRGARAGGRGESCEAFDEPLYETQLAKRTGGKLTPAEPTGGKTARPKPRPPHPGPFKS